MWTRRLAWSKRRVKPGGRPARFVQAAAEYLPFDSGEFDLVTSTISFHHWQDQQEGLHEIGRVLAPGGSVVLADIFAVFGIPAVSSVWAKG